MDSLIAGSSPSRIIFVSSHWHVFATIDFDDLMMDKDFSAVYAYAKSKLAIMLFTRQLAQRLQGSRLSLIIIVIIIIKIKKMK